MNNKRHGNSSSCRQLCMYTAFLCSHAENNCFSVHSHMQINNYFQASSPCYCFELSYKEPHENIDEFM